jgi:hypothetical protein
MTVATCKRVHNAGLVLVVSVGITALVPSIHRDHSANADIGIGHPAPHPRPFRWWILLGLLWDLSLDCCPLAILWEIVFLG